MIIKNFSASLRGEKGMQLFIKRIFKMARFPKKGG
jgi:hypothetical protein